ncbi:MAG: hypothetical protein SGBAC_004585 [Bacillariaceae sp.]
MVLEIHLQSTESPSFALYDVADDITHSKRNTTSKGGVSLQSIGSMIDSLHSCPSKRVRFSEDPEVFEVDYSSVDTNDSWYTRAQLYLVQTETKNCLVPLENHEIVDEIGLERWTKRGAMKFQEHQEVAMSIAVGDSSSSSLARRPSQAMASAYADVGIYAKMMANTRGMKLERQVRNLQALENVPGRPSAISYRSASCPSRITAPSNSRPMPRRPRSSFSRVAGCDISMYRRRSSRCKIAVEEVHTALVSVRRLGLLGMPTAKYDDDV